MKKNKIYIGISGKMGTGKSTLVDGIEKVLSSFVIERVSLAAPIKEMQKQVYDIMGLEMLAEKNRSLLITLGMMGRKEGHKDFWLEKAIKKFEESEADIVICDDVRFENEADWFDNNGILIRLHGKQRGDNVTPEHKNNVSETALDSYKFKNYLLNTKGVEHTLFRAMEIITKELNIVEELTKEA